MKTGATMRYTSDLNPSGTKGLATHNKHWGGGGREGRGMDHSSISRMTNATNMKPWELLGVSFNVLKNSS